MNRSRIKSGMPFFLSIILLISNIAYAYTEPNNNNQDRLNQAKQEIARAEAQNPKIRNLKAAALQEAQVNDRSKHDQNGTNLALKKVAEEFEKQFLKMMWSFASTAGPEQKNFAESHYSSEWNNAIVDSGTELGEIGQAIYEELLDNEKRRGR